ncbi:macrolide 2'-phosphotransferase [Sphingobacterium sp. HJSM2_6]|uniref:macrolide 2'-phosphotransferase n=1 Tax=Sphingobacterium sp. HJSM2_6 TaxID=3366264 RepID=UPI003BED5BBB
MTHQEIKKLALKHELSIQEILKTNEMGIDFKIGFAQDLKNKQWVLRIPRRSDMYDQIQKEKRILDLVKSHLSIEVPNWLIATNELVAYPLLQNNPVLTYDAQTYEVTWFMDQTSPHYIPSLASILVDLHAIPLEEIEHHQLEVKSPEAIRLEINNQFQRVSSEIGIAKNLATRYQRWLDNDQLWPTFSKFIHGDLYAGHVMSSKDGHISGIIDWSTAHMGDSAMDFSGHLNVFSMESLKDLLKAYEELGGQTWDGMFDQIVERAAASPLAYGSFALETQDEQHIQAAKNLLNQS